METIGNPRKPKPHGPNHGPNTLLFIVHGTIFRSSAEKALDSKRGQTCTEKAARRKHVVPPPLRGGADWVSGSGGSTEVAVRPRLKYMHCQTILVLEL